MNIPKNIVSQTVTVKRLIEGHYDENYNWVDSSEVIVATIVNAVILPKSGHERAATIQTTYESDYTMYAGVDDIIFEEGYSELDRGDLVIDSREKKYRIVFPGFYGPVYEAALKEEL